LKAGLTAKKPKYADDITDWSGMSLPHYTATTRNRKDWKRVIHRPSDIKTKLDVDMGR